LERKNKNSKKCFGSLNKWCKTKKSRGAKCKKHRSFGKYFKIPGGAPAPPHIHTAPPMGVLDSGIPSTDTSPF
jgi:hypothetical protein